MKNRRLHWRSIHRCLKRLISSCLPSGTSWVQRDPGSCRNTWASCKNTPAHSIILTKSNICCAPKISHAFLLCLQGEEGPQGPLGDSGDKGDKVGWISWCFSLQVYWQKQRCRKKKKKNRWNISQNCDRDRGPNVHCKISERVFLLQGSRGIQGPQGAVGKKGENVSEHTHKHSWWSGKICQMKPVSFFIDWFFFSSFQGLPGIDGKDGTPGIPGVKVRGNQPWRRCCWWRASSPFSCRRLCFVRPAGRSWPGRDAWSSRSARSGGKWPRWRLGPMIPVGADANDPICTSLLFLRPRSGSICSPCSDKNTDDREWWFWGGRGGWETGVIPSVNLAVFCSLGTLPGEQWPCGLHCFRI